MFSIAWLLCKEGLFDLVRVLAGCCLVPVSQLRACAVQRRGKVTQDMPDWTTWWKVTNFDLLAIRKKIYLYNVMNISSMYTSKINKN